MTPARDRTQPNRDRSDSRRAARRSAILAGWALAVFVVWLGVPFVVVYAIGDMGDPAQLTRGELAGDALRIAAILFGLGVPVLLAWFRLLFSSGLRQSAAVLATLVSLAYAATAIVPGPMPPPLTAEPAVLGPATMPVEHDPALRALRDAAFGFLSVVVSWAFAFALAWIMLRAEPLPAGVGQRSHVPYFRSPEGAR